MYQTDKFCLLRLAFICTTGTTRAADWILLYGGKDKNGTEKKGTLNVEKGIFDKFWKGLGGGRNYPPF